MDQSGPSFGEELRRKRLTANLSLAQLAHIVHYSKGQLSKVERGLKAPSRELARLCDATLDAGGELASLASGPTSRRELLTVGALAVPAVYLGAAMASGAVDNTDIVGIFYNLLNNCRNLGQSTSTNILIPLLADQTKAIQEIARNSGTPASRALLTVASRYAEYTGWLAQEAGADSTALAWTRRAADLAHAAGDADFAAYGLVRHALVTMYAGDAAQTTQLAARAQSGALPPRIRGLAAAREAQGHAIAADYDAAMQAIDRASAFLDSAAQDAEQPVIGSRSVADQAEMTRGWCLYDLGRPREAAELLEQQLILIPEEATRARARYGARCALAYAAAGDVDHACNLTSGLLDDANRVRSATIDIDLRALARALGRHPRNAAVRVLSPRLGSALRPARQ